MNGHADTHPVIHDSILIGSSPISILEAACLKAQGKDVLIVDDADRIGGAWATIQLPVCDNVEIGAHYLAPDARIHEFFREFLNIEMELLDPQPKYVLPRRVFGRTEIPFAQPWAAGVAQPDSNFPMTVRSWRNRLSPYYRALRQVVGLGARRRERMYYYPGGTPQMMERIERMVATYEIPIRLNTRLTDVEANGDAGIIHANLNGERVTTRELVMTSCSSINVIKTPAGMVPLPGKILENQQLHLAFRHCNPSFTIAYFTDSPPIVFATDVTRFCKFPTGREDHRIICLYLGIGVEATPATLAGIIDEMKARGTIDAGSELTHHAWSSFNLPQRSVEELAEIEKRFQPLVRTLFTHSFSVGIALNCERWGRHLRAADRSEARHLAAAQ